MKILITGAAGFVGKNLTEALKNIRDKSFVSVIAEVFICYGFMKQ